MEFWLIVQQHDGERRYRLDGGDVLVGQSPDCAIRLVAPSVSRRHARIRRVHDELTVEDLGSTNGTRVNGTGIDSTGVQLPVGALIEFGELVARVEQRSSAALAIRLDLPAVAADAGVAATMPGTAIGQFVLADLRALLRALRTGASAGALARQACALLDSRFPGTEPLVIQRGTYANDSADAFIAGTSSQATGPDFADEDTGRLWLDESPFRIGWHAHGVDADLTGLASVILELLCLANRGEVSDSGDAIECSDSCAPPEPQSVDARMREIYRQAARVAQARDIGVLIEGESGTGKELLACYLHDASRCGGEMVALNCAALPRDLLEAELFGVERGAATGVNARPGKFEQAHGGTLFLDEIGDLAPEVQAKLLRVLQERRVVRLGGQGPRSIDVRVVAATNRALRHEVEAGRFRLDLYHRIADWAVTLPPLRERRSDLLPLAAHFLERECRKRGLTVSGISRDAHALMKAYHWPGNVRELEREMMRATLFMENGQVVDASLLSDAIRAPLPAGGRESTLTRGAIEAAIDQSQGNMSQAAEHLGVARSTLYRRMKALGIEPP